MSVFTPLTLDEARHFVSSYDVGDVIDFQDIAAGVENSNFFATTTQGRYVLTIFEKIPRADLDFYMGLMAHLHIKGIGCAAPLAARDGTILQTIKDKPSALVLRLSGGDIAHPSTDDCHAVGAALAAMHLAASDFTLPMPNWRGLAWWRRESEGLNALATAAERALLQAEIAHQADFDHLPLPRGIIHADLFRDNVLWDEHDGGHRPQMIDFYFACHDILLWDVAITVNDWCLDLTAYPDAKLHEANTRALLAGYASVRAFTNDEQKYWPQMLRAAALRTWLGRLGYHYTPRASTLTHPKDHPFSARLLQRHISHEALHAKWIPEASCKS